MALISLNGVSLAFGGPPLLDNITLQIQSRQRVCLLGRNGAGKSTLMKVLDGQISPQSGEIIRDSGVRTAFFAQEIPEDLSGTVYELIAHGLGEPGALLARYHNEERRLKEAGLSGSKTLEELSERLTATGGWSRLEEISIIMSKMDLEADWQYADLSGGQRRRVLLAAALVCKPDLLLLDEPTNHMDLETIAWLEEFLLRENLTVLFVTHDRMLLRRLATRIVELDRGKLVDWSCDYDTFLERKQAVLDAQEREWAQFDKKLSEEEVWIRKGIKARRTRNEGRVRALVKMREERSQRRERAGNVNMNISEAELSGKLVMVAENLTFGYDENLLIRDFSARIARGDKIGILGPNGCGKSTLIKLLLGQLKPLAGEVLRGSNLRIAYYDQMRAQLDSTKSIWENVQPNGDTVMVDGKPRHIVSYLQDFLFSAERTRAPITHLSGGERNRLLLARLFAQPTNLLVMDEPTNDLDLETLELLEALLVDYAGTLLLISHDRTFINNVVTNTLAFAGDGEIRDYVGGYDDWLNKREAALQREKEKAAPPAQKEAPRPKAKTKLSYKESREMETLPGEIEAMEGEVHALQMKLADHTFYEDKDAVTLARERIEELEKRLTTAYERWEYLEGLSG